MVGAADRSPLIVAGARPSPQRLPAREPGGPVFALAALLGLPAIGVHLTTGLWQAPRLGAGFAGLLVALLGLVVIAASAWTFHLAGSARRPGRLIDEGPYRYSRHPMYLGLLALGCGLGLGLGMPLLMLAAGVWIGLIARFHVPQEEARLTQRFGGWYRDYAASVPRWL